VISPYCMERGQNLGTKRYMVSYHLSNYMNTKFRRKGMENGKSKKIDLLLG